MPVRDVATSARGFLGPLKLVREENHVAGRPVGAFWVGNFSGE